MGTKEVTVQLLDSSIRRVVQAVEPEEMQPVRNTTKQERRGGA